MNSQIDFEQARFNMIEQQIRPWEVLDTNVLDLLQEIHREDFVSEEHRGLALADLNIPLAHDQVMMTPKMEARLLQAVELKETDSVLEVGTGSGYLTALMSRFASNVESIDIYGDFIAEATTRLKSYGIDNVKLAESDYFGDWKYDKAYDVIVLTGSLPTLDMAIQENLAIGGRLFAVVGEAPVMEARLVRRVGESDYATEVILETELPALVGANSPSSFEL